MVVELGASDVDVEVEVEVETAVDPVTDSLVVVGALALIIHGTSGWLVSMDGLGCGVALAG